MVEVVVPAAHSRFTTVSGTHEHPSVGHQSPELLLGTALPPCAAEAVWLVSPTIAASASASITCRVLSPFPSSMSDSLVSCLSTMLRRSPLSGRSTLRELRYLDVYIAAMWFSSNHDPMRVDPLELRDRGQWWQKKQVSRRHEVGAVTVMLLGVTGTESHWL